MLLPLRYPGPSGRYSGRGVTATLTASPWALPPYNSTSRRLAATTTVLANLSRRRPCAQMSVCGESPHWTRRPRSVKAVSPAHGSVQAILHNTAPGEVPIPRLETRLRLYLHLIGSTFNVVALFPPGTPLQPHQGVWDALWTCGPADERQPYLPDASAHNK